MKSFGALRICIIVLFIIFVGGIILLQLDFSEDDSTYVGGSSGSRYGSEDLFGEDPNRTVQRFAILVDDEYSLDSSQEQNKEHVIANTPIRIEDHASGEIVFSATTDEHGQITLDVPSNQSWRFKVPGFFDGGPVASARFFFDTEYRLTRIRSSKITVVDMEGKPLPDTWMSIYAQPANAPILSVSGSECILTPLRPVDYRLVVQHPFLLDDERILRGGEDVLVQLSDRTDLHIFVETADRRPVADAELDLLSIQSGKFIPCGTAYTQTDGSARFSSLKEGVYSLGCAHPWYSGRDRYRITIDRMHESHTITLPLPKGKISGHVYDAKTMQPLEGIPVVCGPHMEQPRARSGLSPAAQLVAPATQTVYTDAEGAFLITHLWNGRYNVYIDSIESYISGDAIGANNEHSSYLKHVILSHQEPTASVDFHLIRPWVITGTVYDPSGKPLPNQEVRGHRAIQARALNSSSDEAARSLIRNTRSDQNEHFGLISKTDENGRYRMTGKLDKPSILIVADHEIYGLAKQTIRFVTGMIEPTKENPYHDVSISPGEERVVDLHFKVIPTVKGTVKDHLGNPIHEAHVTFITDWSSIAQKQIHEGKGFTGNFFTEASTDRQGQYELEFKVPYGQDEAVYAVIVSAPGYKRVTRLKPHERIRVKRNTRALYDFTLMPGEEETLEGIVVDEEGNPLEGVDLYLRNHLKISRPYINRDGSQVMRNHEQLTLIPRRNSPDSTVYTSTKSGPDGTFVFDLFYFEPSIGHWLNTHDEKTSEDWDDLQFEIVATGKYILKNHNHPQNAHPRELGYLCKYGEKNIRLVVGSREKPEIDEENESIEILTIHLKVTDFQNASLRQFDLIVIPQHPPQNFEEAHPYYQWTPISTHDGTHTISDLKRAQGGFTVAVRNAIYPTASSRLVFAADLRRGAVTKVASEVEEIEIKLGPGASIRGNLIDAKTKQPLSGLKVSCMLSMDGKNAQNVLRGGQSSYSAHSSIEQSLPETVTDEHGAFYLLSIPIPGVFIRVAESQQYREHILPVRPLNFGESKFLGDIEMRAK